MLWDPCIEGPKTQVIDRFSVVAMTYSQDGQFLASGLSHGIVEVWEVLSGARRWTFRDHPETETVYMFAFSPDNQILASCSDVSIILWDMTTGAQLKRLLGIHDQDSCMVFSYDTKILATSYGNTTMLWNRVKDSSEHVKIGRAHV